MKKTAVVLSTSFLSILLVIVMVISVLPIGVSAALGVSDNRQKVIDYMRDMATIEWTAGKTFSTVKGGTFYSNKKYYGIPYSQNTSITNSVSDTIYIALSTFKTMLSNNNGLISQDIGRNDCSYAVCKAWSRVDSGVKILNTASMNPGVNNIVAVGNYTFKTDKATTCDINGEDTMYKAYACLKPGDAVIRDGHVMLVSTVDSANQKITVIHQSGGNKYYDGTKAVQTSSARNTSWGVDEPFSYATLYSQGYIPITCKVLSEDTSSTNPVITSYGSYEWFQAKMYAKLYEDVMVDYPSSPASFLYEDLKNDKQTQKLLAGFNTLHLITETGTFSKDKSYIRKSDMYALALMDVLNISDPTTAGYKIYESALDQVIETELQLISEFVETSGMAKDVVLTSVSISVDTIEFLEKVVSENKKWKEIFADTPAFEDSLDEVDALATIFNAVETVGEAIEMIAAYVSISDLESGTVSALEAIAADTRNDNSLRIAAQNCASYVKGAKFNVIADIVSNKSMQFLWEETINNTVDYILSSIPYVNCAFWTVKAFAMIGDIVGSWDKKVEAYYQMETLSNIEKALDNVVSDANVKFAKDDSDANAAYYMSSYKFYRQSILLGADYVVEFLEIYKNDGWNSFLNLIGLGNTETYDEVITNIKTTKAQQINNNIEAEKVILKEYDKYKAGATFGDLVDLKRWNIGATAGSGIIADLQPSDNNYVLLISGSGKMLDWAAEYAVPWNSYADQIVGIEISDGITNIGNYAFSDLNNVVTVSLPAKLTKIGNNAFACCEALTSVKIPSGVTSIGDYAFASCNGMSSVTIPSTVKTIGSGAFEFCDSLTTVTIPNSVTSIGAGAFQSCSSLESITLSNKLTKISDEMLMYCSNLKSLTIPSTVTEIGDSACSGCNGLKEVSLPSSLSKIGDYAFYECIGLTAVDLPTTITTIGASAFGECYLLKSVTLPNNLKTVGDHAFNECAIETLTIPNSVTKIGSYAFSGCDSLSTLKIGTGLSGLATGIFQGCTSLEVITIPNNIVTIGSAAFKDCSSVTKITLSDHLSVIGDAAFQNCSSFTEIAFPKTLTEVGAKAFDKCLSLHDVYITDLVAWCNVYFEEGLCYPIGEQTPHTQNTYDRDLYLNGEKVTHLVIPEEVTCIGQFAFYYFTNIETLTLHDKLITIEDQVFEGSKKLSKIISGNNVQTIGAGAFFRCYSLVTITLPDSVVTIGDYAFEHCINLVEFNMGKGVEIVGAGAFIECDLLKHVTMKNNIQIIKEYAFLRCPVLEKITYCGTAEEWENITKENTWNEDAGEFTIAYHDYPELPVPLNDTHHHFVCTLCNEGTIPSAHIFTRRDTAPEYRASYATHTEQARYYISCKCGQKGNVTFAHGELLDPNFKIRSAKLEIAQDISVIYRITIPEGYTNFYVVFNFLNTDYKVFGTRNEDGSYAYKFPNVLPQQMGENLKATLYATYNGDELCTSVDTYSVRQYCVNQLNKSIDTRLHRLLSDLLEYGAAAQKYCGYDTDNLVTNGLNLVASTFVTLDESVNKKMLSGIKDDSTYWKSAGLMYENAMAMYIKFAASDVEDLKIKLSIADRTVTYNVADLSTDENGFYTLYFRDIYATQFDDVVTAIFLRNEEQVGQTMTYSVNSYVYSMQNSADAKLVELMKATYNYGESAHSYMYDLYVMDQEGNIGGGVTVKNEPYPSYGKIFGKFHWLY